MFRVGVCHDETRVMPEPAGRHNRSPGRKSWVDVVTRTSPVGRHTGFHLIDEEVSSLKGLGTIYNAYPALTCWATIVTPFGLRIDGSHSFAGFYKRECHEKTPFPALKARSIQPACFRVPTP